MTEEQYKSMEEKAKAAFDQFPESHAGTYYPLTGDRIRILITNSEEKNLFRHDRRGPGSTDCRSFSV